jgi:hypothetical protein
MPDSCPIHLAPPGPDRFTAVRNTTRKSNVSSRLRLVPLGFLPIAATLLLTAASAHASLLTVNAPTCPVAPDSQAFLAWGDSAEYFLAPDGDFAHSGAGWALSGGAAAVPGGDGDSLGGNPPSTQSLALPDGSSATSTQICVGINSPSIRFLARNAGAPSSTLAVTATVDTTLGLNTTIPIATISASGSWNPTAPLALVANLLPLLPGNQTPITLTFTPQGQGGNWQIDDLYVDPWTRGGGGG